MRSRRGDASGCLPVRRRAALVRQRGERDPSTSYIFTTGRRAASRPASVARPWSPPRSSPSTTARDAASSPRRSFGGSGLGVLPAACREAPAMSLSRRGRVRRTPSPASRPSRTHAISDVARFGALAGCSRKAERAGHRHPGGLDYAVYESGDRRRLEVAIRRRGPVQQGELEDGAPSAAAGSTSIRRGRSVVAIVGERRTARRSRGARDPRILKNDVSSVALSAASSALRALEALKSALGDRGVRGARDETVSRGGLRGRTRAAAGALRARRRSACRAALRRAPVARARAPRRHHRRLRRGARDRHGLPLRRADPRLSWSRSHAALAAYGSPRLRLLRRRVMRLDLAGIGPHGATYRSTGRRCFRRVAGSS